MGLCFNVNLSVHILDRMLTEAAPDPLCLWNVVAELIHLTHDAIHCFDYTLTGTFAAASGVYMVSVWIAVVSESFDAIADCMKAGLVYEKRTA